MKTTKTSFIKCGLCGYASLKMMDLHKHLIEHIGSVGYFYDISQQVAFPIWTYDRPTVKLNMYSQTDEGISIEKQNNSGFPEIKDEESTVVVNTEFFEGAVDKENDFDNILHEDTPDNGLEFYEENPSFNGITDSKVLCVSDRENSKHEHYLQSVNFNDVQIEKTMIEFEKKPKKKQRKRKPRKIGQRKKTKKCTTEKLQGSMETESVVNGQSKGPHTKQETDIFDMSDQDDVNTIPIDKLDTLIHEGVHKVCDVCGMAFRDKQTWKRHRSLIRCKIKRYLCNICGKRVLYPHMVRDHQISHSDEHSLFCDQCGKGFKTKQYLDFHLKCVHNEEKNYKCEQCGKSFNVSAHLNKHLRIHNNVLLYSCQFCGKRFSTNWNLKAHMRQHTGTKPYLCSKCGESFAHNVSRKTHEAKCSIVPAGNNT